MNLNPPSPPLKLRLANLSCHASQNNHLQICKVLQLPDGVLCSQARYASYRHGRGFRVSAQQGQSGEGKRITQNEFTDKAWQSIIAAPDIAKQVC